MNISLPEPLKEWVDKQVAEGGYSTASEYVREMLRREQLQKLRQSIDDRLTAAINSGPSTPMTKRDWARIRAEGRRQVARRAIK